MSDATSTGASALDAALASVGDRWSLLVVEALLDGPMRFGQLEAAVPAIAPNVLASRLRHLEGEGLVLARPYSRRPPRFAYELTPAGRELGGAVAVLSTWGAQRSGEVADRHHTTCGTAVEARWWCPTCARTIDDDEADDSHHA